MPQVRQAQDREWPEIQAQLVRADDLSRDAQTMTGAQRERQVRRAIELAAQATSWAENAYHEQQNRHYLGDFAREKRDMDQWSMRFARAAHRTAQLYERASFVGGVRGASDMLYAGKFYELAARVAPEISNVRKTALQDGARASKQFEADVTKLTPGEREDLRLTEFAIDIGLGSLNRSDVRQRALYEGRVKEDIRERGRNVQRFQNCQRVAPAFASKLLGVHISEVGERGKDGVDFAPDNAFLIYEWGYGGKFEHAGLEDLTAQLLEAGEGAVGLLGISRLGSGHVAAVTVRDGRPIYLEGQTGQLEVIRGSQLSRERGANYSLLIVHDPKRDLVKVDEGKRYAEIRDALEGKIDFRKVPCRARIDALMEHGKSGFPGTDIAQKVAAAKAVQAAIAHTDPRTKERRLLLRQLGLDSRETGSTIRMNGREIRQPAVLLGGEEGTPLLVLDDQKGKALVRQPLDRKTDLLVSSDGLVTSRQPIEMTVIKLEGLDLAKLTREATAIAREHGTPVAQLPQQREATKANDTLV